MPSELEQQLKGYLEQAGATAQPPALKTLGPDEPKFRSWYGEHAKRLKLSPDPDAPEHFYDWRSAYRAGAKPNPEGHWPSQFKRQGHPNLVVGGVDTRTGQPAGGTTLDQQLNSYLRGTLVPTPEAPSAWSQVGPALRETLGMRTPEEAVGELRRVEPPRRTMTPAEEVVAPVGEALTTPLRTPTGEPGSLERLATTMGRWPEKAMHVAYSPLTAAGRLAEQGIEQGPRLFRPLEMIAEQVTGLKLGLTEPASTFFSRFVGEAVPYLAQILPFAKKPPAFRPEGGVARWAQEPGPPKALPGRVGAPEALPAAPPPSDVPEFWPTPRALPAAPVLAELPGRVVGDVTPLPAPRVGEHPGRFALPGQVPLGETGEAGAMEVGRVPPQPEPPPVTPAVTPPRPPEPSPVTPRVTGAPRPGEVRAGANPAFAAERARWQKRLSEIDAGTVNLSDPDEVYAYIRGVGRIRPGPDVPEAPFFFKSRQGKAFDELVQEIADAQGKPVKAVENQLANTLMRYQSLRAAKRAERAAPQAPPSEAPPTMEGWEAMSESERTAHLPSWLQGVTPPIPLPDLPPEEQDTTKGRLYRALQIVGLAAPAIGLAGMRWRPRQGARGLGGFVSEDRRFHVEQKSPDVWEARDARLGAKATFSTFHEARKWAEGRTGAPPTPSEPPGTPVAPRTEPPGVTPPAEPPTRFERTPMGDQALIPGAEGREIPKGPIRAPVPQRPIEETPLFGQERAAREVRMEGAEGRLFGEPPGQEPPARFLGWQEVPGKEPVPLYQLTREVPGHPAESTVSAETLRELGIEPPVAPARGGLGDILSDERGFFKPSLPGWRAPDPTETAGWKLAQRAEATMNWGRLVGEHFRRKLGGLIAPNEHHAASQYLDTGDAKWLDQLSPRAQSGVRGFRKMTERYAGLARATGELGEQQTVENYFTHILQGPAKAVAEASRRFSGARQHSPFFQHRTFPTLDSIEQWLRQEGFEGQGVRVVRDPGEVARAYTTAYHRAEALRTVARDLATSVTHDGRPVLTAGEEGLGGQRAGYVVFEHPLLRSAAGGKTPMVDARYAPALGSLLTPGLQLPKFLKQLDTLNNIHRGIVMALPWKHGLFNVGMDALMLTGLWRGVLHGDWLRARSMGSRMLRQMDPFVYNLATQGEMRLPTIQAPMEDIRRSLSDILRHAGIPGAKSVGRFWERVERITWEEMVGSWMVGTSKLLKDRMDAGQLPAAFRASGITPQAWRAMPEAERFKVLGRTMNLVAGQLPRTLFEHPNFLQGLRQVMFSPSWNVSNVGMVDAAIGRQASWALRGLGPAERKATTAFMREYAARSIAMHYAFTAVWQAATTAALTGTAWMLWDNPKGLRTRLYAGKDPEGRDRYAMSPVGYFAKDLENAAYGVAGLARGEPEAAQQFARSKLAVMPKMVAEAAFGFRDPFERREEHLGGQSALQGFERRLESLADAVVPYRTFRRDPVGGVMAETGLPFRRAQTPEQVHGRLRAEEREFHSLMRGAQHRGNPGHAEELRAQWERRRDELRDELRDLERYEARRGR